jgi:hypothetical protein
MNGFKGAKRQTKINTFTRPFTLPLRVTRSSSLSLGRTPNRKIFPSDSIHFSRPRRRFPPVREPEARRT